MGRVLLVSRTGWGFIPTYRCLSPPPVACPHLPWFVPACHGLSPPAIVCPHLPWFIPAACRSSPPAMVHSCHLSFVPTCHLSLFPTCHGLSLPPLVCPCLPWFIPAACCLSPPAVVRPLLHPPLPLSRPLFALAWAFIFALVCACLGPRSCSFALVWLCSSPFRACLPSFMFGFVPHLPTLENPVCIK